MTLLVRSAVLTNYLEVTRHLQLDVDELLIEANLSPSLINDANAHISARAAANLLERSAQLSGCDTLGLRMAELRQLADFGEVSLLLSHQQTLRDALNVIVQYRHLLNNSLAIFIEETGKTVMIRVELIHESGSQSRQSIELAIAVTHRFCAALLGVHWRPLSVCFTHQAPADLSVHRRVFGCKAEFGCEFNGIACLATHLDSTNPLGNEAMARHAERYLNSLKGKNEPSLAFDVRKSIYLLMPMGKATPEYIAQSQGMNIRTMQRRLEADGTRFSELFNEVRCDLVIRYLKNPGYSLGRISDMLGYSMPSSFTRWFNAQFGKSPVAWRTEYKIINSAP